MLLGLLASVKSLCSVKRASGCCMQCSWPRRRRESDLHPGKAEFRANAKYEQSHNCRESRRQRPFRLGEVRVRFEEQKHTGGAEARSRGSREEAGPSLKGRTGAGGWGCCEQSMGGNLAGEPLLREDSPHCGVRLPPHCSPGARTLDLTRNSGQIRKHKPPLRTASHPPPFILCPHPRATPHLAFNLIKIPRVREPPPR